MRPSALVPVVLIAGGIGLVALSVLRGDAQLFLVVIVPIVYGGSLLFVSGVLLFLAGIFLLPLAFEPAAEESVPTSDEGSRIGTGGVVLIGPVPIFFGAWRTAPAWVKVLLAALGGAALIALVVVALLVSRA